MRDGRSPAPITTRTRATTRVPTPSTMLAHPGTGSAKSMIKKAPSTTSTMASSSHGLRNNSEFIATRP